MKTQIEAALLQAWFPGIDSRRAWWYCGLLPLLWCLSWLFRGVAACRRYYLQSRQPLLPLPLVIVGNITVGGAGKTPLLAALAKRLVQQGQRVGIISRGYGGSYDGAPRLVDVGDEAALVGDEPLLLARSTGCPVVVAHDRFAAVQYHLQLHALDIILSDDGLQHYALPRTVEIAVLDGNRSVGNGLCLPAGPLREPVTRLQEVDFVVINGKPGLGLRADEYVTALLPTGWLPLAGGELLPLDALPAGSRVHAVAGIGNPQRFFDTLRSLGLQVIEHALADHHAFVATDLQFGDALPVVMTEKDAVKCAAFASQRCYALRVEMPLSPDWVHALMARVEARFRRVE